MGEGIQNFVSKIVRDLSPNDDRLALQQRQTGCTSLVNPLPLDTTSQEVILLTQELISFGDDADNFFDMIRESQASSDQEKSIFCSAATSGMGKTHLAYSVGKHMPMILIRIADKDAFNPLTEPWSHLCTVLSPLNKEYDEQGSCYDRSKRALRFIKLLVCCYVDATVSALEYGSKCQLDGVRLRELALRFNRNGTCEHIVAELFREKCNMFDNDNFKVLLDSYCADVNVRLSNVFGEQERLLLCFDEIQELLRIFPQLFIQSSALDIKPDNDMDDSMSRGLFYGVACAMCSLTRRCKNWVMYMTGTSLTITKLYAANGVSNSLLRSRLHECSVCSSLMTSTTMKLMLQHYWAIPDNVFTPHIMKLLDKFRGRPYFFVEGVFKMVYVKLCCSHLVLTSELFSTILEKCLARVKKNMHRRIDRMFQANRSLPYAEDKTVHALIPSLIKTVICGAGKLNLRDDEDVSRAILDGVIIASSHNADDSRPTEIDISATEPLVYEALQTYLGGMPIDKIMSFVLNQIRGDSGSTAEEMFCYWLALKTYAHLREKRSRIPLGDLLLPLYDGDNPAYYPKELLNEYECDAVKVIDLENGPFETQLEIVRVNNQIASMRTDAIYFRIDTFCGVDIIFIVKNRYNGAFKMVAIQSKNDKSITVKDALLTLSPGTQYLENAWREYVITGGKYKKGAVPSKKRQCGPGDVKWDAWSRFCKDCGTSIGNNWIRIALVSRKVNEDIHEYVGKEQFLRNFSDKTRLLYWTLFASHTKILKRAQLRDKAELASRCSPLILLSLSSSSWMTEKLRQDFVNFEPVDGGVSFPRNRKESVYWVPISVEDAEKALIALPFVVNEAACLHN